MKLAIVTGANGALGRAYLNRLINTSCVNSINCVGISRTNVREKIPGVTYIESTDLLDRENVRKKIDRELPLGNSGEVLFVHPVGRFKFEENQVPEVDHDLDGIDDEVYKSNVVTFRNVEDTLLELAKQQGLVTDFLLCGFGSVSDRYKVPYWLSYSRSKDILRQQISGKTRQNGAGPTVKGVFVNVSTVDTYNENTIRPYADKTYWLKPDEIVDDSLQVILGQSRIRNLEMDIFKPMPGFDPEQYYLPDNVLERWMREMGRVSG